MISLSLIQVLVQVQLKFGPEPVLPWSGEVRNRQRAVKEVDCYLLAPLIDHFCSKSSRLNADQAAMHLHVASALGLVKIKLRVQVRLRSGLSLVQLRFRSA